MTCVQYPPSFHQRVLAVEAPGGEPWKVAVVIPTVTRPGKPFDVKISVMDDNGYPSMCSDIVIKVRDDAEKSVIAEVGFCRGRPAVATIKNVTIDKEGFHRFAAELGRLKFFSNPTFCTSGGEPNIYWGDPHVHTILSNCHPDKCRSLNFCYTAARYLTCLDWTAAADHVSNGRCGYDKWKEQTAACNAHNDMGEFATLPGYEASFKGGAGGDNNIYFLRHPEMFVDHCDNGTVKTVCRELRKGLLAEDFFVVPHHTTRSGKHGEIPDEIYPGADLMPVIEIHSKWGTSEYRGNPNPLKKIHPGPSFAVDLLNRGLLLGFIAGTDSHATFPSGGGIEPDHIDRLPGMTAVYGGEISRGEVFQAIRNRRCYATSLERIYLNGRIGGTCFGQSLPWKVAAEARSVEFSVAAQSNLAKVELVRNGEVIVDFDCDGWNGEFLFTDKESLDEICIESEYLGRFVYYYVRVTCESGAQAWSSPVWLIL